MLSTIIPRLAEPARWLTIVGIAVTLAQTVLYFVSGPETATGSVSVAPGAAPAKRQPTSINAILARNLFGVAGETQAEARTAPTVETRLPLELRGVFVGDIESDSAAIVAQKGKSGELYVIGDVVPGNAELAEVHADHIVLRRAGNLETLFFPQVSGGDLLAEASFEDDEPYVDEVYDDGTGPPEDWAEPSSPDENAQSQPTPGGRPPQSSAATPRELIDNYRERLDTDPDSVLNDLGIAPVSPGSSEGYRLGNLASSPYLSQTGLQPGDVVLSVNGAPVGDVQQDRGQIDAILEQGSARLEVQRGTRRFFVTASLK